MASSTPADGDMRPPKRRRTESMTSNTTQHREVGIMRQEGDRGASFIGSASGIHFVQSVYNAVNHASPKEAQSSRQGLVPGEEDQLPDDSSDGGTKRLWRPGETSPSSESEVTFGDLVRWSQSYFDQWHPVLPFLHAPSFLNWCEAISQQSLARAVELLSPHQMVIVRSVLSTSLMDRRQNSSHLSEDAVPLSIVFESFHDAITSVQTALVAAPSIESLQAAVSVQVFLISMLRHNAASRVGGIIIRLLFQMGMHRCPYRYSAFSPQDCVLRQRVFWSVYCLDRYICQSLGIPLTLRDDDIDVCMLDTEQHEREEDLSCAMDPRLKLLCLCARHSIIKGLILELCNKSINYRHLDMNEIARVRTMIARWSNDVDNFLDGASNDSLTFNPLHQLILGVLKDESIIALNRPLLTGERSGEAYDSALQACIASSRSIIRSLARDGDKTPLVWPSFTWAVWMSGFIVLYATTEGELPLNVALSLVDQCTNTLDLLSARDSIWPKTCAKVVRDLAERIRKSVDPSPESQQGQSETAVSDLAPPAEEVGSSNAPIPMLDQNMRLNGPAQDFFSNVFDQGPDTVDLFRGFDIPFWLGDDQYPDVMNNWWNQ